MHAKSSLYKAINSFVEETKSLGSESGRIRVEYKPNLDSAKNPGGNRLPLVIDYDWDSITSGNRLWVSSS